MLIFRVSFEVFVWKASKTRGFCMVDVSKVKQQEAATRAPQSNRQRSRINATKETEDTTAFAWTSSPPPPPHPDSISIHHHANITMKNCNMKSSRVRLQKQNVINSPPPHPTCNNNQKAGTLIPSRAKTRQRTTNGIKPQYPECA